jgi:exonuclease SbcD
MLRVVHTSDWHLGHLLHDLPRSREHAAFLDWLIEVLEAERADALLVAGDIFDTSNPPAEAQEAWYRFLAQAKRRLPALDIVAIGGNHDSAARLDAPDPVLRALGVRVLGALPRKNGVLDPEAAVVPLHDAEGGVAAWVAAVPFLRPADLPSADGETLIAAVRDTYRAVCDAARARCSTGQALLAMGHAYMTGTTLSELSERKILGGNLHALPVDVFPEDAAYVALGHLHLPQRVGGLEHIRYSGSPIPLAIDERRYPHQIVVVDCDGPRVAELRTLRVPRAVEMLRVPEGPALPLEEVVLMLRALEARGPEVPEWKRPFLEVRVLLPEPDPELRRRIDDALEGKAARLLSLRVQLLGSGAALADGMSVESLADLGPEQVFLRCYDRVFGGEPSDELRAAFAELVEAAERGEP